MGLHVRIFVMVMIAFTGIFCTGDTDLLDAINSLYAALGLPPLQGWKTTGGDPCAELWQGVACVFSNITQLSLRGMNLGGELGSNLNFPSIIEIDLSNNHIGGPIPSTLPPTLRNLSLSGNQLNGSIPDALSSLTQLLDLSLSNNLLDGQIPDVFQQLTVLINIDLSANNLSGQLPPSMGNLSSLSTLHLQNNELSGFLNVLQDLPLQDLNIENNLFFGPIPPQLLSIPNLRKDGNPFNTTAMPSPPAAAPAPVAMAPSPIQAPWNVANSPFTVDAPMPASARKSFISKNVSWIAIAGFLVFITLGVCLFMLWCFKRRPENKNGIKSDVGVDTISLHKHQYTDSLEKASGKSIKSLGYGEQNRRTNMILNVQDEQEIHVNKVSAGSKLATLRPPPSPLPINLGEKDLMKRAIPTKVTERQVMTSFLQVYTIASLQQYANSFSQENYIGEGTLGVVYQAELPDGKQLAVKKLDATSSIGHEQFLQLVCNISKIQHANIVKLMGYCAENGQQFLVYDYFSNRTLHDALHKDNELHAKLSWNARIRVALGAASALEYLHENLQPPVVHQNFKSANVLLNTELEAHVCDCGFGPLLSSGSAGQLSGRLLTAYGYGAPELESGSYTKQSDVFSFGVVMLELLTGRKSCDRSRPHGEQFLVRWAVPQLHDIDALTKMVDPSLNGAYSMKSLSRFADIISSCLQHEPEFRPAMAEVVQDLLRMI
ncbi:protein STRUBBELIG-RECEPTOR FAMILY 3-like isoform X2 [Prosopis cineraria]|uniref:protein STRUBBELIG-RECEPTOR FAMILY 3-like isoform X2 n=1 Tax=Prosopis cineraria TaxID=364024 RepID=UPI00240F2FB5|nr:protein STRUBBELIG-RECEPTOR FAMILY 3-like isoform X2 [Prosopis cineraria]